MADEPTLAQRLQSPTTRWLIAVLAVLALLQVGFFVTRRPKGTARGERAPVRLNIRREPATPEARALLAPLTEGSEVAGWRVTVLEGPREGLIHVVLHKGADDIEILIARRQGTTVSSPVVSGPYAFFNMGLPHLDRQAMGVMRALGDALRAKASAPLPPGLGPFEPRR
jgi:hypothetical protein